MYLQGLAAFALFFLHDFNDIKLGQKWLRVCFPAGGILLAATTITACLPFSVAPAGPVWARIILGIIGLALLWAEVYSLFFSFSKEEAYGADAKAADAGAKAAGGNADAGDDGAAEGQGKRPLATDRMYKLCRHPGVTFFVLLYVDLWLCMGLDPALTLMLCSLNVALAAFEDLIVFPKIFAGYEEYRETTPFLVPNCNSIRGCIGDFRRKR